MSLPLPEPVVIDDGDLLLRAFAPADLDPLVRVFADEEIVRWNRSPGDRRGAEEWMARRNDWASGEHVSWAVAAPSGELLGSVSLHHVDWEQEDAEAGYWVAPWARRRGVGRRALLLASGFAFERLAMHRIYLYHAVENTASCRLATAAGFRLEGQLRQSHIYADGQRHDEHLHGRLSTDR